MVKLVYLVLSFLQLLHFNLDEANTHTDYTFGPRRGLIVHTNGLQLYNCFYILPRRGLIVHTDGLQL